MIDTETQEILETPVEQQIEQPVEQVEQVEAPVEEKPIEESKPAEPVVETYSSKRFKAIKEEKERAQRERDELMRMLQEERNRNQPQPQAPVDDFGIDDNNFAEGKDLKRFAKEVRELKQELQQYKQKTALEVTETRLRTEYPDFNKVFSDDNIELFKAEYPEIAETILNSNASPYSVAKSAYKMIKQLGIHVEDNSAPDRAVVQKNLSKPRPAATVSPRQGSTPLSKVDDFGAEDLTEERAAALRREVAMYKR